MHPLHSQILADIESERFGREAEAYFEQLRAAGIEPGTSRKSLLSWLRRPQRGRVETSAMHRPRPV